MHVKFKEGFVRIIFFSGEGVAIHVPVKKGKSVTGKYVLLKKKKKKKKKLSETAFSHGFQTYPTSTYM